MEQKEGEQSQCMLFGRKVGFPELINIYYKALMIFLVFTAGNELAKGLIDEVRIELLLYVLLWMSIVVQTTFAYKHIKEIEPNKYNILALVSDGLDICLFIYVCAAMSKICAPNEFDDMTTYRHISIPFLILSVNQFCWYIVVQEEKHRTAKAIFRLILLFVVMLVITILDGILHHIGLLAGIVIWNIVVMVIMRAKECAPDSFVNKLCTWWDKVKHTDFIRKKREWLLTLPK